jgi:glycosyltransferase involved in cell wall biosynthesis
MNDFEVILIDDGSTDSSGKICEQYASKDKRFKIIHQKNAGVSAARNRALKSAKGEYITFLDSDDAIGKHYLRKLLNAAERYNTDVVVSPIIKFVKKLPKEISSSTIKKVTPEIAITNLLYGKHDAYWGGPGAKLFKTSLLKSQYFREDLKYSEDVDFFYIALQKAQAVVALEYAGFMYRIRPGSATQAGFKPAFMDYRIEQGKALKNVKNPKIQKAWKSNISFNMVYYLSVMNKAQDKKYWDKAMNIIKSYRLSVVFDPNQKWDQKLTIIGTFLGGSFAANMLRWARNCRISDAT